MKIEITTIVRITSAVDVDESTSLALGKTTADELQVRTTRATIDTMKGYTLMGGNAEITEVAMVGEGLYAYRVIA